NALFDGDSHAMKQSGTELITAMADLLRPHARLRISIAALGFEKKPGETLQEQSLKRARTVGKLFSIYGWPADKLRIQEKTHQSKQDQPATGSRVEIYIYAD
ncbi:MAG TPA: hypothetical protein VFX48_04970, partial [Saprospiraceae bacterium]|nr:hypothetical protein [Saprospiraceae bacterium]